MNRKLRHDLAANQAIVDEAENKARTSEQLMATLKSGSTDEISDRLIELSERLNTYKLTELRSKRAANELRDKEEYL
ncbi:MAG: hypothetical protein V2I33_17585 [Kangiellaceae bacterium]|nr:hypothetical protein [Kangiellaceae bacterium]